MLQRARPAHQKLLKPVLVIVGLTVVFAYGTVALLSRDPVWFQSKVSMPDPLQIVIRVAGEETVLTASDPGYPLVAEAARKALSGYASWAPGSMGLSPATLDEYQMRGTILELYFGEPVDFHLPFDDGKPTALLFPMEGRYGGQGYVFRGRAGKWWAGQLTVSDPQPLVDALATLGYVQR